MTASRMLTEAPESIMTNILHPAIFTWHFGGLGIPERFAMVKTYSGSESESGGALGWIWVTFLTCCEDGSLVRQTRAKCPIFPQDLQSASGWASSKMRVCPTAVSTGFFDTILFSSASYVTRLLVLKTGSWVPS